MDTVTLNQYTGTSAVGVATTIVAEDMETAASIYKTQLLVDPVTLQCVKSGVRCVLPATYVTFKVACVTSTGTAATTCSATPASYTVKSGTQQIFTATAGDGFTFTKWTINGVDAGTSAVALLTIPASIDATTDTVTIQAVFTANA